MRERITGQNSGWAASPRASARAFLDQDLGEPLVVSYRPGPAGPGQRVVFESFAYEAFQAPVDDRASD